MLSMGDLIQQAVELLRAGRLVAFPTETVYGLGADATSGRAIDRIYAVKGRPATNPLIVHVADESVARRYAACWPESAGRLARAFWPGPLTLVLPKNPLIVDEATAGLGTVGLRCPDHPLALELLRAFDGPIAAPSANKSNHVSPTTAGHVRDELGDEVDLVLDGGPCRVGIESTVLDLTGHWPRILRPGAITAAQIERVTGQKASRVNASLDGQAPAVSPGQQILHYAPRTPAYRFGPREVGRVVDWCRSRAGLRWAVVATTDPRPGSSLGQLLSELDEGHRLVLMGDDPEQYARRLYATLRALDEQGLDAILIQLPPAGMEWLAIGDRLMRATRPIPFSS